jgi:guanylate kinase
MAGILYIISAPSGSGKSTLVNELLRLVPNLKFSVSYTTRAPRGSETNGKEYFFVSRREFEDMIRRGEFLEYAEVFGNYYGTAKKVFQEAASAGLDLLMDIDVQGASQVKKSHPEAVSIFILPPSRQVLEKRLRNREASRPTEKAMSDEVIERRLLEAQREIGNSQEYDYILVNNQLDAATDRLKAIVLWERCKHQKADPTPSDHRYEELANECLKNAAKAGDKLQEILATFAPVSS